jgi:hypothetical protein
MLSRAAFVVVTLAVHAPCAAGWSAACGARPGAISAPRSHCAMVFRAPKSDAETAIAQAEAAAKSAMSPEEWTEATRAAAKELLSSGGAHVAPVTDDASPPQTASFLPNLWGVGSVSAVPAEVAADPSRVLATVYEIGGPLTTVLSTSVAKTLPLIPHVGTPPAAAAAS